MKNKGFTLIELMVVIVIIGILAAIAIPKLFGMNAKARAAEIGPASGSWSKLSQAYYSETSSLGTWASIGYTAPGEPQAGTGISATTFLQYEDLDYAATPTVSRWQATAQKLSKSCDGQIWAAQYTGAAIQITGLGCQDLTPNFRNLQ